MIDIENVRANIKFAGNAQGYKIAMENDEVTIYVETLFNLDLYETELTTDLSYVKVSEYEYTLTGDILGFNRIQITITDKPKVKQTRSNTLLLIVK